MALAAWAAVGCQSVDATSGLAPREGDVSSTVVQGRSLPTETKPAGRPIAQRQRSASPPGAPALRRSPSTSSSRPFELLVSTGLGTIYASIAPLPATMHSDGTAEAVDPPHNTVREWLTAVWITQSAYPSAPSTGTSYIYGHACHYHVCAFTNLGNARVGDGIAVTTSSDVLRYRVCATGVSPKSSNLEVPHCANRTPDLVLVTCEYEQGDTSTNNLVVAATLTGANSQQS